ncbi:MAG: chromate resistance protein ChrB domain-containing protein [Dongiaceae bacterium]
MSDSFNIVSPDELRRLIGRPDCPPVIDVRRRAVFEAAETIIPGSQWRDHAEAGNWSRQLIAGSDVIVYCVHGHNVSQAAMADLRRLGYRARALTGGIEAYTDAGGVLLQKAALPAGGWETPSRWITRERPKIDRIACPWLVRRFIDPTAEFYYVAADQVEAAGVDLKATPYDIPGAAFSHDGDLCSFDAFISRFGIKDPALDRLALIVRGADTGHPELAPQCAGLLATSLGLSALYTDDHEMLHHGLTLYDAFYAWCREASAETHGWPPVATAQAPKLRV